MPFYWLFMRKRLTSICPLNHIQGGIRYQSLCCLNHPMCWYLIMIPKEHLYAHLHSTYHLISKTATATPHALGKYCHLTFCRSYFDISKSMDAFAVLPFSWKSPHLCSGCDILSIPCGAFFFHDGRSCFLRLPLRWEECSSTFSAARLFSRSYHCLIHLCCRSAAPARRCTIVRRSQKLAKMIFILQRCCRCVFELTY